MDEFGSIGSVLAQHLRKKGIKASLQSADAIISHSISEPAGGFILVHSKKGTDQIWNPADEQFMTKAFALTKAVAKELRESAKEGGALFASVTQLDGQFGLAGVDQINPLSGALAGLTKTVAREWTDVSCHAFDLSSSWRKDDSIEMLVQDLLGKGSIEVGYREGQRYELEMIEADPTDEATTLEAGDVVVVSGGAQGVTKDVVVELANKHQPTLVLLGRSEAVDELPEWLDGLTEDAQIKRAILQKEFAPATPTPAQLDKVFRRYKNARTINATLDEIHKSGAKAYYHSVDVCNEKAVAELFHQVRAEIGPIKGLVHAAGVLRDYNIVDKSLEQFEQVFATKVNGLRCLLNNVEEGELKLLALFSSVSGRMGNVGQVDYAMANEVLNKVARWYQAKQPHCKAVALNWGPWDGGMVTPVLRKNFLKSGINLIPLKEGAESFVQEINSSRADVEVILGDSFSETHIIEKSIPALEIEDNTNKPIAEMEFSLQNMPILDSHVIGGRSVVPLALILEWIADSVKKKFPKWHFKGMDNLQVLRGIRLPEHADYHINMYADKVQEDANTLKVEVEVKGSWEREDDRLHYRSTVHLAKELPLAKRAAMVPQFEHMYPHSLEHVYGNILFHGTKLWVIKEIHSYADDGIVGEIESIGTPESWFEKPGYSEWISEPNILDGAFQLAIVWGMEVCDRASLPTNCGEYRQYQPHFPKEKVKVTLQVTEISPYQMKGDFQFIDQNGALVASIKGYEAVMEASLAQSFKQRHIKREG